MTYLFRLNDQDLAVIAAGLGELPLKVAKATFDKLNAQVAEQTARSSVENHQPAPDVDS
jgi:hypothetical protein